MKIHTYEKAFLGVSIVLLVACMIALVYATSVLGLHLPGHVQDIDPHALDTTPPFDQPGVRQTGPNEYEAVVIGSAWSFSPAEIRVPAGARVTFTATAREILHGFSIAGTRVNLMLIPGQVSQAEYTFDAPGEYLLICHEYCGLGHHLMSGKVIVE